jgi:hypothetical protein
LTYIKICGCLGDLDRIAMVAACVRNIASQFWCNSHSQRTGFAHERHYGHSESCSALPQDASSAEDPWDAWRSRGAGLGRARSSIGFFGWLQPIWSQTAQSEQLNFFGPCLRRTFPVEVLHLEEVEDTAGTGSMLESCWEHCQRKSNRERTVSLLGWCQLKVVQLTSLAMFGTWIAAEGLAGHDLLMECSPERQPGWGRFFDCLMPYETQIRQAHLAQERTPLDWNFF